MKKRFEAAKVEVIKLQNSSILTTSTCTLDCGYNGCDPNTCGKDCGFFGGK